MKKIKNNQSKNGGLSFLKTDSLIIILIIFTTYALYFYKYFPDDSKIDTFLFSFESKKYRSVYVFMWVLLSKLTPLILFTIWFTTCKHWWYYSIAIPIAVYVFQIVSVVNEDLKLIDESEFAYSLPITAIILLVLLMIRSKISIYLKAVNLKKEADDVINKGIEKQKKKQEEMKNRKLF